jgi:hypothetical protein
MSPNCRSILSLFALATAAFGCGDGTAKPGGSGMAGMGGKMMPGMTGTAGSGGSVTTGAGGAGGTTMPMGTGGKPMKPGMTGTAGTAVVIGIPTPGTPGTVFPGGGPNGSSGLKPGCTPASATECPSASGTCATSSTSTPTNVTTGSVCFYGPITTTTTTTPAPHAATIEYLHETAGGKEYYRFRITFDPAFVDNTYGVNAIGWVTKGHTFKDLVGSDHAELSLWDGTKTLVSMFDIDYITASTAVTCGYDALGVSGGEGKMLTGDAKYILASTTSLDRNLNGCGYCKSSACGGDCTIDSPATDAKYTPNAAAPNWDYRVVYEVWVDAAVFAGKGFYGASITFVHASPSKASSNTVSVTPRPCDGGGCPEGAMPIKNADGTVTCSPNGGCPEGATPIKNADGTITCSAGGCPEGATPVKNPDGTYTCSPGGGCPEGATAIRQPDGTYTCSSGGCPTGTYPIEAGDGSTKCSPCPNGQLPTAAGEGWTCTPCPTGYTLQVDSEGFHCAVNPG